MIINLYKFNELEATCYGQIPLSTNDVNTLLSYLNLTDYVPSANKSSLAVFTGDLPSTVKTFSILSDDQVAKSTYIRFSCSDNAYYVFECLTN